ncbi:alcohol dehydrogenase catalytic domain-containing protein [Oenococcus oeni]|uniref:alcohol dehydrogenase catalytic domain-containing protein n=1 Tax=Oenococcus oeni TaxID=1247 RepID=UPI0011D0541D|nr:alcohol dehydrogenase catalytic domain-containing protein [Oenococcus oeni]
MKAIGFKEHLPIEEKNSFIEFELPKPIARGHDLLVKVSAVSVNPVDVGVRKSGHGILKAPKIIGWDAVGTVESIGDKVSLFKKGDLVFYAGSFKRPGSDSQYQLVDERIVGHAPKNLTIAQIAAMPLTSLTVWEWMYTKSFYGTSDMTSQHQILDRVAQLLDQGIIKSTLNKALSPINVLNLKKAHQLVESNQMIGKVIIANKE